MADSTAQTYRAAALEHLDRADRLHADSDFFLAHFVAGLAVECHLRAYLRRFTDAFDSKHDLARLTRESRFYDIVPQKRVEDFSAKFSLLNARWRSNHRYYSVRQFLDYMNEPNAQSQEDLQALGDKRKNLSRTIVNLAPSISRRQSRAVNLAPSISRRQSRAVNLAPSISRLRLSIREKQNGTRS